MRWPHVELALGLSPGMFLPRGGGKQCLVFPLSSQASPSCLRLLFTWTVTHHRSKDSSRGESFANSGFIPAQESGVGTISEPDHVISSSSVPELLPLPAACDTYTLPQSLSQRGHATY